MAIRRPGPQSLDIFQSGILPPPPGGSFRDYCGAQDTSRYLEALRTLEDADIEEGRDDLTQAWSVDGERTEAAIKTMRLGHSYDGTNVVLSESYSDFLSRSKQLGEWSLVLRERSLFCSASVVCFTGACPLSSTAFGDLC